LDVRIEQEEQTTHSPEGTLMNIESEREETYTPIEEEKQEPFG